MWSGHSKSKQGWIPSFVIGAPTRLFASRQMHVLNDVEALSTEYTCTTRSAEHYHWHYRVESDKYVLFQQLGIIGTGVLLLLVQ